MAVYGGDVYRGDEDQRWTLAADRYANQECLIWQALLDIVSMANSELLNSDPTREYVYD